MERCGAQRRSATSPKPQGLHLRALRAGGRPCRIRSVLAGCATLCQRTSNRAQVCHTAELVANLRCRGRARSCHALPGCDQRRCTLHCTLDSARSQHPPIGVAPRPTRCPAEIQVTGNPPYDLNHGAVFHHDRRSEPDPATPPACRASNATASSPTTATLAS